MNLCICYKNKFTFKFYFLFRLNTDFTLSYNANESSRLLIFLAEISIRNMIRDIIQDKTNDDKQ